MLEIIEWVQENSAEAWTIFASIVAIASVVVKLTPTKRDDGIFGLIMKILDALALNPQTRKPNPEQAALEAEVNARNDAGTRTQLTSELR